MITIRETELAWAAGFFDGEGCSMVSIAKNGNGRTLTLSLAQVEKEPFDRFVRAVGGGNLQYRQPKNPAARPINLWRVNNQVAVEVMALLRPYLSGPKISQFDRALLIAQQGVNWGKPRGKYERLLKSHCKYGHPFDETNTYTRPDNGQRACRTCRSILKRNEHTS